MNIKYTSHLDHKFVASSEFCIFCWYIPKFNLLQVSRNAIQAIQNIQHPAKHDVPYCLENYQTQKAKIFIWQECQITVSKWLPFERRINSWWLNIVMFWIWTLLLFKVKTVLLFHIICKKCRAGSANINLPTTYLTHVPEAQMTLLQKLLEFTNLQPLPFLHCLPALHNYLGSSSGKCEL